MSRKSNIRWSENDLKELRRITRNYNAKVNRERKNLLKKDKRYQAAQLPANASVRDLRKSIETRKDYKSEIERMQNFIDTGRKFVMDKNTEKSFNATVSDFNRKVRSLQKKAKTAGERAALPELLDREKMLKEAPSKKALIEDIKAYKGFLKSGAEEIVDLKDNGENKFNIKMTKWQKSLMDERLKIVNENRAKELEAWKETDVKYGGRKAGYKHGAARMDDGDFDGLGEMELYTFSTDYTGLRKKINLIMRESREGYWDARTELARINYTETMEKLMGHHPAGKRLLQHIKSMPLKDFKRTLKSEDDLWLTLYKAKLHPEEFEMAVEEVWNQWREDAMPTV